MTNLIAFINMFLSYLFVFVIFMAAIIVAVMVGIKCRKKKDAKDELLKTQETEGENLNG